MRNFWAELKRPFFVLAPMADVTDPAFRALIARIGKLARTRGERGGPDVTFTEFVSADGLFHTMQSLPSDENPLLRDLRYSEAERPVVAQIFGGNPDTIAFSAELAANLGFDGIDINMGCPDRAIEKQGAGAAMIKTPELAPKIIQAAKDGASCGKAGGLPVSVKTRIGYGKEAIDEWIPALLSANPAALAVHLRTRKEMSKVPAHWELMPKIVALRDKLNPSVPIVGNGDVKDLDDARKKARETGADGIMLGRAIFGNPWLFAGKKPEDTPIDEKLATLVMLARAFEELRPRKSFHILKKHVKAFVTGFDGAAELRAKLMDTSSADELANVIAANRL